MLPMDLFRLTPRIKDISLTDRLSFIRQMEQELHVQSTHLSQKRG